MNFREIVDNNADGILVLSNTNIVLYSNQKAEELLNISLTESENQRLDFDFGANHSAEINITVEGSEFRTLHYKYVEAKWNNNINAKIITLRDITELKQNQERVSHLNKLLKTIGSINHLIVTERDRDKLTQRACELLTESGNYKSAWIGTFSSDNKISKFAHSGIEDDLDKFHAYLNSCEEIYCVNKILDSAEVLDLADTAKTCKTCPLSGSYSKKGGLAVRIAHENEIYGIIVVSRPSNLVPGKEEDKLISEVAADIGLALHTRTVEERDKISQEKLLWLNEALKEAANAVVLTNREGKIEWVNPAFVKLTGYGMNEVIGNTPAMLKSGKHGKKFYNELWKTISAGKIWNGEVINKKKNGTLYTEEMTITPVKNNKGEILRYIAIKSDVTERKIAESKLIESEDRYRSLYKNAPIGIYRSKPSGEILMANPAFLELLGFNNLNELTKGKQAEMLYKDEIHRNVFKEIILKEGVVRGFESVLISKTGKEIHIRENAKLIEQNGDIVFEGIVEDISIKKETEKALIKAKEEAQKSERLKGEFLAQMSHEIRTPLNAILSATSYVENELRDKANNDIIDTFNIIDSSGNRIIRTIEAVLNMSELQSGTYEIISTKFDLFKEIIEPAVKKYSKAVMSKGLSIDINKPNSEISVNLDRYSTTQIFTNILDNAVKYTREGKIKVDVETKSQNLLLKITDTGIGITEDYLSTIFDPFSQEAQGYSRPYDGCGLGLALTKRYCDLNNADISLKSERGKGTSVNVMFSNCIT